MKRALTIAAILLPATAFADELAEKSRAVVQRHGDAIVTLRFVISERFAFQSLGSEESESVVETHGTRTGPDGLLVTSLAQTDPTSMFDSLFSMLGDDAGFTMDSSVDRLTIVYADGTEHEGRVVLRDNDLDLAFVRPDEAPEAPLPYVDLSAAATLQQFDPILLLFRMGKVTNRACGGIPMRVTAVMEKPRTFYVLGLGDVGGNLGAAAFTLDGRCVGITVLRNIDVGGPGGGSSPFSMLSSLASLAEGIAIVVLPAEDVLNGASQAPSYDDLEAEDEGEPEE